MKKIKRILAVMLCLCMAMSILPVGAAATGAEEVNINFTTLAVNGKYNTDNYILSTNDGYIAAKQLSDSRGIQIQGYADRWAAFKLGELKAGYYDGLLTIFPFSNADKFAFYIVAEKATAAEIEAEIASSTPVMVVDCNAATGGKDAVFNAYLPTDGNYMLVGKYVDGTLDSNFYYLYLKALSMKRIGGNPADFADKASIDFTGADTFAENTTNGTWLRSRADDTYVTFTHGNKVQNGQDMRHVYFWTRYDTGFMAFDLGTITDGDYKGKITYATTNNANLGGEYNFYLVKVNAAVTGNATCGGNVLNDIHVTLNNPMTWEVNETHLLETINFLADSGSYWNAAEFEADDVSAGHYYLVAIPTAGNAGKYGYLQGFEMVPADFEYATAGTEANAEGKALFGDNYAYIRKDGDAWVVNFFGGIKATEGYIEVGFEVNGEKFGSDKVYSTLNVGGQNINNSLFGADVAYVFGEEVTLENVSGAIEFKAYAKTAEGDYVYGNTYTAVIE